MAVGVPTKKYNHRHQKRQYNRTSATTVDCSAPLFCTVVRSLVTYYIGSMFFWPLSLRSLPRLFFRRERGVYTVNAANPFHDY